MRQDEIEKIISKHRGRIAELSRQIQKINLEISELRAELRELDDPHALIPNSFTSIDEWLDGHPFPDAVNSMRFKNKSEAFDVQTTCNTYQTDYHIVRL